MWLQMSQTAAKVVGEENQRILSSVWTELDYGLVSTVCRRSYRSGSAADATTKRLARPFGPEGIHVDAISSRRCRFGRDVCGFFNMNADIAARHRSSGRRCWSQSSIWPRAGAPANAAAGTPEGKHHTARSRIGTRSGGRRIGCSLSRRDAGDPDGLGP